MRSKRTSFTHAMVVCYAEELYSSWDKREELYGAVGCQPAMSVRRDRGDGGENTRESGFK